MVTIARASGTLLMLGLCTALIASGSGGCKGDTSPAGCPQTMCGSSCVSLQTDPGNCGSCGHACAPLEICDLGVCTTGADGSLEAASDAPPETQAEAQADTQADTPADAVIDAGSDAAADGADASGE